MSETKEISYVAIITINLPDSASPTHLKVTLMPSDQIIAPDGTHKPLQDCTLGELSHFADTLEADVLARYHSSTLVDLALDGQAEVTFNYEDSDGDHLPPSELWLEQIVILPEGQQQLGDDTTQDPEADLSNNVSEESTGPGETALDPMEGSSEAGSQESEGDSEAVETLPTEPDLQTSAVVDSSKADEIDVEISTEELVREELQQEPVVTVAEAELVHKEREAPALEEVLVPTTPERPSVRILGRRRPLDHPTWTAVDILVNEKAFRDAQAHSLTSLDREVAGVLIGPPPEKQPDGRYVVHVSDTIIAKHTRMHGASVTYTPESWRYVNDKLADMYPDEEAVIVGWYHTHPGFGIFLSGMDQFIHQNFFTQVWHVAMVLDPLAHRSGFFCWDRQQTKVDTYEFPWPHWATGSW